MELGRVLVSLFLLNGIYCEISKFKYKKTGLDGTGMTVREYESRDKFHCFNECNMDAVCQGVQYDRSGSRFENGLCRVIYDLQLCFAGNTNIYVKLDFFALSVGYSGITASEVNDPVPFNHIGLGQVGGQFDPITHRFVVPRGGIYVTSLLAYGNSYHLKLNGALQTSVHRYEEGINMNSRTFMYNYNTNDILFVASDSVCITCQITWTLWFLGLAFRSQINFMVGRTTSFALSTDPIPFDSVIMNDGNGWNSATNEYIVPKSGVYSLTLTTACSAGKDNYSKMHVNNQLKAHLYCDNINHADLMTANKGWINQLNAGDRVHVTSDKYKGASFFDVYSDSTLQASISGFLYDPIHGCPVVWSALRTTDNLPGSALSPIAFELVPVNVGGSFSNNMVTCPITGTYVVYINFEQRGQDDMEILLVKDGTLLYELIVRDPDSNAGGTTSRTVLDNCQQGEQLWLETGNNSAFYGDPSSGTSFSGFLLYT